MSEMAGTIDNNYDQVVFENIPDQYVKGEDVTVHFTILNDIMGRQNQFQIGLSRVGSIDIQECVAYAPAEFTRSLNSSEISHRGSARFPSSSLPTTDDEFYHFCFIINKRKCLGSSIPFQLNCSIDDIDLLSDKTSNGLIAFADQDNDDLVIVQTQRVLVEEKLRQENRQLFETNRRLELQKDECKARLDLLDHKSNEYITKIKNDMQLLATTHKGTIDELATRQRLEAKLRTEYDACRSLCTQYQSESIQFAERCRALEESNTQLTTDANKLRSQLLSATRLTDEQAVAIVEFEERLIHSDELLKTAKRNQSQLEQKLNDVRLTTEKYRMSMQGQLDAYAKQASQQENQIHALESANCLLKDELSSVKDESKFLLSMTKQDRMVVNELQQRLDELTEEHQVEIEQKQYQLETLRKEFEQSKEHQNDYVLLKNSFNEIEKRCVKHQKSEIEVKKQLTVYKQFVTDLQRQIQELTERLSDGADAYKGLYRKYAALERMVVKANNQTSTIPKSNPTTLSNETGLNEEALVTLLRNSYELQQQDQQQKPQIEEEDDDDEEEEKETKTPVSNEEIRECPMCYWEFPKHLTLENKKEHIENHFA